VVSRALGARLFDVHDHDLCFALQMRPDVSVVIPTYNRRSMVQQAIESCFEGNDEIDVEVVVVDDGSTDGTRE